MSASLLSSFIVFFTLGLVSVFSPITEGSLLSGLDEEISWLVRLSIVANAVYFYYFAALVELHGPWRDKLQTGTRTEWIIRLLNQTMMLAIWEILRLKALFFGIYLVALSATFIIWDLVTRDVLETKVGRKLLAGTDFTGLFVSLGLFAFTTFYLPSHKDAHITWVIVGMLTFAYALIACVGVSKGVNKIGFKPFSRDLYKRTHLH